MKYITFTVPCYNSAAYMERCVDSLLIGGEDVEILLIDDGSTDRTGRSRTNMSETIRESCVRYTSRRRTRLRRQRGTAPCDGAVF